MIRIEATRGETIRIEWFFTNLGVNETSLRTSHITVEVRSETGKALRLNNIQGGVLANVKKKRVWADVKTGELQSGIHQVWVTVLKRDGSEARKMTHLLVVTEVRA